MKRRTQISLVGVTNRRFPSIVLFKSGIEELLEIVQEENPSSINIEDMEYSYDSLDEFFSKYQGKEIKFLRFTAFLSEPFMVTIGRSGVSAFAIKTTPTVLGLILRLEHFFKSHERASTGLLFNPFVYFVTLAGLLVLIANMSITRASRLMIGVPLLMFALLFFYNNRTGGFSRIFSIDQHEQESFWLRNKDQLIIGLLGVLLGSILTVIGTYVLVKTGVISK